MPAIVPHAFLFRYSIPVHAAAGLPKQGKKLLDLADEYVLPSFAELDGAEKPFAELRVGWNPRGIGFSVDVRGKKRPLQCDARQPAESDGLQVWIDTRNTQSVHRATRFCHHFCLLPSVGTAKSAVPYASEQLIAQTREVPKLAEPDSIPLAVETRRDGYLLEAWLPAEVLRGFDPEANPRLGFYCAVRDRELGEQFLTVGRDFPFQHDPSVWSTLELTR